MKRYLKDPLDCANVVLVGLFSANEMQYEVRLDELAVLAEARGSRVVGRYFQRRGASDRWNERPGGADRMSRPFSRRTLLTNGKIREIAEACRKSDVDAVIFVNTLTHVQRTVLADILGCLVFNSDDLAAPGGICSSGPTRFPEVAFHGNIASSLAVLGRAAEAARVLASERSSGRAPGRQ